MSMLTPPGMGGKYRITGRRIPHMRRPRNRRRIVLVLVATAAVLGLAGWGTFQLVDVFGGGHSTTRAASRPGKKSGDCTSTQADGRTAPRAAPKELPKPGDFTVNVYNATPRGGLAKITADELARRGFKIGQVGNAQAEYDKKVGGTAILLGPRDSVDGTLKVLGTQLTGLEAKDDQREGQEVDLVLGDAFKALTPKEEADRALAGLDGQQPSAPPASSAPPAPSPSAASASAKC